MELRQDIWEARLLAHASLRYFETLSDRYGLSAKGLQLVGLVLSSGAAAALLAKAPTWVALCTAIASALSSAVQTTFSPAAGAIGAASAARHWRRRIAVWDLLWLELHEQSATVDLDRFKLERARDVDFDEPKLLYHRRLSERSLDDAVRVLTPSTLT